jgi:hypothetical protein
MRPPAPRGIACRAALGLAAVAAFALALAPACKDRQDRGAGAASGSAAADPAQRPPVPDRIEGTLTLDGQPLAIARCRPGHEDTVYVDMVTAAGALRFVSGQSEQMYWNPRPDANVRGEPIPCSIPHRSWGGARRDDGTAYFRGELAFSCRGAPGALVGKLSLECGNISPLERALLDDGRRRRREAQGLPASP